MIHLSFICEGTNLLFIYTTVHGSETVTVIIILKVNHYIFFSSFFLHKILEVKAVLGKYHVIVWLELLCSWVRTLLFFFTLSCMVAKYRHPLGEMNFQKRFTEVLITSYTFIWEAAVAIVSLFVFACWSEYCSIIIWVAPWTCFTTCEEMMIH